MMTLGCRNRHFNCSYTGLTVCICPEKGNKSNSELLLNQEQPPYIGNKINTSTKENICAFSDCFGSCNWRKGGNVVKESHSDSYLKRAAMEFAKAFNIHTFHWNSKEMRLEWNAPRLVHSEEQTGDSLGSTTGSSNSKYYTQTLVPVSNKKRNLKKLGVPNDVVDEDDCKKKRIKQQAEDDYGGTKVLGESIKKGVHESFLSNYEQKVQSMDTTLLGREVTRIFNKVSDEKNSSRYEEDLNLLIQKNIKDHSGSFVLDEELDHKITQQIMNEKFNLLLQTKLKKNLTLCFYCRNGLAKPGEFCVSCLSNKRKDTVDELFIGGTNRNTKYCGSLCWENHSLGKSQQQEMDGSTCGTTGRGKQGIHETESLVSNVHMKNKGRKKRDPGICDTENKDVHKFEQNEKEYVYICHFQHCKRSFRKTNMLLCVKCRKAFHSTCCDPPLTYELVSRHPWSCNECKECEICLSNKNEETMLICDACDRAYHMECMNPRVDKVPEGDWFCFDCGHCGCCERILSKQEAKDVNGFYFSNRKICLQCKESTAGMTSLPPNSPLQSISPYLQNAAHSCGSMFTTSGSYNSFNKTERKIVAKHDNNKVSPKVKLDESIYNSHLLCAVCIKPFTKDNQEIRCTSCEESIHQSCCSDRNHKGQTICKVCKEIELGFGFQ